MAPSATTTNGDKPTVAFRKHLPDLSTPRFTTMKQQSAHEYAHAFIHREHQPPWLFALYKHWRSLFEETYKGVTTDGNVIPDLFKVQDEGLDLEPMVAAADAVLAALSPEEVKLVRHHIDSPEWRSWSNPEFLLSDKGVRLDLIAPEKRTPIIALLKAVLSPEGYAKAISAMRINAYLGQLVDAEAVMNENSYNLVIFGTPSTTRPWGFQFYGHHLCLNIFLYRNQIVLSPFFTGAEPNEIDAGPYAGTTILTREAALGLELMQSLTPELQKKAQIFPTLHDPAMPAGRWNQDDQRHYCGAYRDNRVVPLEGVRGDELNDAQLTLVKEIIAEYHLYLPEPARSAHIKRATSLLPETYFSWIGAYGDNDAFYYRIQNPLIIVEFDHHSGVFLNNSEPAKFHIHTILRTPNQGDYGMALRKQIPAVDDVFVWDGK